MELPTKGSLSEVSFIEILKDLSASSLTGMVRLETGPVIKVVYLQSGTIAFASSNEKSDRLTEVLKRAGKLTPEQIEHAQARIKPNVSLGKTLVELGYISPKDLLWGARMQVEGILYQLLFWEKGSYQVLEGPLPKEIVSLGLTAPQIIYNGILQTRDRDWILRHIGSPEAIYAKIPDFEQKYAEYHLGAEQISDNIDGAHSLEEIAQSIGIDTFEVCKTVAALQVLELARPQPFKPTQMPLSVSETQETQNVDVDSTETAEEDVSLGQVMHVPTVEELSDQPAEEPYIAQSYTEPVEEQPDLDEIISSAEEEQTKFSPFRQLNETEKADEETYDSEFEEAVEEQRGWNKGIILVALLGILSAAGSFYYVGKYPNTTKAATPNVVAKVPVTKKGVTEGTKPPVATTTNNNSGTQTPTPNHVKSGTQTSTPAQINSGTQTPTPAPVKPSVQNSPIDLALNGKVSEAAGLWKRELSKQRNRLTIQLEIACQNSTVLEALNLFSKTDPLYVVPLSFRGQPCYRVLYGIYDNEDQAKTKLSAMPSEFTQQPSPPKVIPISKALQ
ncbi:DUF4388 domain-containing protein [bacterium]|nr:DUF4388 domain-containing protein [bacterium]